MEPMAEITFEVIEEASHTENLSSSTQIKEFLLKRANQMHTPLKEKDHDMLINKLKDDKMRVWLGRAQSGFTDEQMHE